jgi:hypothetical protein
MLTDKGKVMLCEAIAKNGASLEAEIPFDTIDIILTERGFTVAMNYQGRPTSIKDYPTKVQTGDVINLNQITGTYRAKLD